MATKFNAKLAILAGINLSMLVACNSGTKTSSANLPTNSVSNLDASKALNVQNGVPVTDPAINAMVPLLYIQISQDAQSLCSATLLDSTTILTAAHCALNMTSKKAGAVYTKQNVISAQNFRVVLSKDLTKPVDINSGNKADWNVYTVQDVYVHHDAFKGANVSGEGFEIDDENQLNDLAIIKLAKPVDAQYKFASIATENPLVGTPELITGYGVNYGKNAKTTAQKDAGILRFANSKVAGLNAKGTYIQVGGIVDKKVGYTKICQGDSGGPDFVNNDGNFVITGVHSYGDGSNCGSPTTPASSVSAAYYASWINGGYLQQHI
jgi:secreted trypsin-like serine protease